MRKTYFPTIQILSEIKFGNFEDSQIAILTFLEAQNLELWEF